jgi:crossover junction endodeoxyribonuclease RusA
MTITISLPFPRPELSPNARLHWAKKSKAVKLARAEAYYVTRTEYCACPQPERVAVTLYFYPPNKRHVDLDNLQARMKSALDGICDALGWNDHCIKQVTSSLLDPITNGGVDIIIE